MQKLNRHFWPVCVEQDLGQRRQTFGIVGINCNGLARFRLGARVVALLYQMDLQALRLGAIGFDAIKHLLLCRIERRPPRLDLDVYPYLPKAQVETTSAKAYMSLIGGSRP